MYFANFVTSGVNVSSVLYMTFNAHFFFPFDCLYIYVHYVYYAAADLWRIKIHIVSEPASGWKAVWNV